MPDSIKADRHITTRLRVWSGRHLRCLPRLLAGLTLVAASFAWSATLSAPSTTVVPGETAILSVAFSAEGQAVSGVQFDLAWDSSLDIHVATGLQVGISSKVLYASSPQARTMRCLIVGLNGNALGDGELIRAFATAGPSTLPGTVQVNFMNLSATGPDGTPISLRAAPASIQTQVGSAQLIRPQSVLNAASLVSGAVSPGEIITLFGSISAASPVVRVNGVVAPIIYAGLNQVNAIVPFGLDLGGPARLEVQQGSVDTTISVPVAAAAPAIFVLGSTGTGPGAILNQDYSVNSSSNPAAPGSVIMVYGTGFGALDPVPADGQIAALLAMTASSVTATVAGVPAQVLYAGVAPGLIAGANQINVRIPDGLPANLAAPISLSVGSATTQVGVTVSVQ